MYGSPRRSVYNCALGLSEGFEPRGSNRAGLELLTGDRISRIRAYNHTAGAWEARACQPQTDQRPYFLR